MITKINGIIFNTDKFIVAKHTEVSDEQPKEYWKLYLEEGYSIKTFEDPYAILREGYI